VQYLTVLPGLVPGIHAVQWLCCRKAIRHLLLDEVHDGVGARDKRGHDAVGWPRHSRDKFVAFIFLKFIGSRGG